MREAITTILDVLALLLVAFGTGCAIFVSVECASAIVAGGIIWTGVRVIDWTATPDLAPAWWRRIRKGGRT